MPAPHADCRALPPECSALSTARALALPPRRAPQAPADRPRAPFEHSLPLRSPAASPAHTHVPSPASDTVTLLCAPLPERGIYRSARRAVREPPYFGFWILDFGLAPTKASEAPEHWAASSDAFHPPEPLPLPAIQNPKSKIQNPNRSLPRLPESSRPRRPRGSAAARVPAS